MTVQSSAVAEDFKVGDTVKVPLKMLDKFPSKLTRRYLVTRTGTVIEVHPSTSDVPMSLKNAVRVKWHKMSNRSTEKEILHCPEHLEKVP